MSSVKAFAKQDRQTASQPAGQNSRQSAAQMNNNDYTKHINWVKLQKQPLPPPKKKTQQKQQQTQQQQNKLLFTISSTSVRYECFVHVVKND